MAAAAQGKIAVGEILIANGADVDASVGAVTALSLALIGGHIHFMELLLRHGASLDCGGVSIEKQIPACRFAPKKETAIRSLLQEHRTK